MAKKSLGAKLSRGASIFYIGETFAQAADARGELLGSSVMTGHIVGAMDGYVVRRTHAINLHDGLQIRPRGLDGRWQFSER